jgi:hypothetical protein
MIVLALIVLITCVMYIKFCSDVQVAIVHEKYTYYVNNNQSDASKLRKVKILHELRSKMNRLLDELKSPKYATEEPIQILLKKNSRRNIQLDELPNASSLSQTFAFNVNKGERISICLTRENTINDLFFVVMHEVAHSMTSEYAHNEHFWTNFKRLIEISMDIGLYENRNYSKSPKKFCNFALNHNPYFDDYVIY